MGENKKQEFIKKVLQNMPQDWLDLTTHRLDIYEEKLAKVQFIEEFDKLFHDNNYNSSALEKLPTAYDYIRLGHPLSCIFEWYIASFNDLSSSAVISFSSKTVPILSILRKNLLDNKNTLICYNNNLPQCFDAEVLRNIYGYNFELKKINNVEEIPSFSGSTIFLSERKDLEVNFIESSELVDFFIYTYASLGSVLIVNKDRNTNYIGDIQHVRRRETIAMTPANCLIALKQITGHNVMETISNPMAKNKVVECVQDIAGIKTNPLVASSGLSIQYAILMGLIHHAKENYPEKNIKIIVPPNCYGGTNDQARRVAASVKNVEVLDLPVDGGNDMVQGIHTVLEKVALEDAVPYIIAEIPTNPRVEVPNLKLLKKALSMERKTSNGQVAIDPVFILDQTFCPNVQFLGEGQTLSTVRTISFASGSKFPSGGKCTAGYCIGNQQTIDLIEKIEKHLSLCDNEATNLQYNILSQQMPSMIQRIADAYDNTREFVTFIEEKLPEAKINFVSNELAEQGFTPSVFSLDLPTKGNTEEEKENYKRALNLKLIDLMITKIPEESKYCVSYGQLKGCYWTIPATSTQGTTKEGDKDYIIRASLSPNLNLGLHKEVFLEFIQNIV